VKLIKKGADSNRCQAITAKGSQCTRSSLKDGYCKQHQGLVDAQKKVVINSGNLPLEEVPVCPVKLGEKGGLSWRIYCQYLIDEGRLYQVYLYGIADLCRLEDEIEECRENMSKMGAVNIYDNGIQRNGYASHYDKLISHARSLRADYGLTVSSNKFQSKKAEPKQYGNLKKKGF